MSAAAIAGLIIGSACFVVGIVVGAGFQLGRDTGKVER